MAAFIRCPSCGFCIGKYFEFFDHAKHAFITSSINESKHKDYDPEKLSFTPGAVPPLEPIFDAINIKNRCCRMRIMTRTNLESQYK
jgi:DNA-directed RNA polymerase subunit N (RpoN/RPB10)